MAKTLANIQTNVRMYLDEAQAADYLDSEVNIAINYAYQDLVGTVMEVKEDYYETLSPFQYALIANQQEYTIDSSLLKVTRVEINVTPNISGAQALKAIPIKMAEMLINIGNTSTVNFLGSEGYYLHGDQVTQKIGFIPIPTISDTGNTKSISVWGIQSQSDLVNTTDTVNIPHADRWSYLIALRAASQLLSKGQQDERSGSKYDQMYTQGVERLKSFLANRQEDDMEIVQDSELMNTDFGWPL